MGDFSAKTGMVHPVRKVSRSGRVHRPVLTICQALRTGSRKTGTFIAVVTDPETGEVLRESPVWDGSLGETVELRIEWQEHAEQPNG